MTEDEHLAWLKKIMPMVATLMTLGTFAVIRLASHDNGTALLVAGIMFGFVLFLYGARIVLGVKGFVVVIGAGALILWRLQRNGYF
ncbi:hypothetical protein A8B82_18185 [Sulfitobacter sp. EhC04]|uniref:hypothetical protein n=1 Tax=Sulfitobacter sp. EhC04 TaxID=1849168 RepID=UPI0007F4E13F|nr:hypothetical protein [Sulfitobacter sp. EhC04]OAN74378.1 hypothetical protein A8B82_18185 [Sulfitobacter sp. EhC04]